MTGTDFSKVSNGTLLFIFGGSWGMLSKNSKCMTEKTARELVRALKNCPDLLARVSPGTMVAYSPEFIESVKEDAMAAHSELMRRLQLAHPEPES